MSFIIPRGTTGASAAVQATENSAVSSTDEVWGNLTVPVATVAGQQDVSRQSLERGTPGIDEIIYSDIAGAYGVAVDQQVISGTGSSGQVLGILATSGVNQATAFGAAATAQTFYSKFAGQINAIQTTRFMSPTISFMHPRRWNWLLTQFDSQNRPLVVPQNVAMNPLGTLAGLADPPATMANGNLITLPIVTDASIPTAVGTGPEDQVILARREDLLLWEVGDGMPRRLQFEQTLGANLTVKLVGYNYIAFSAGRYPTAVGIVGGNATTSGWGLAAPSF
jgi:HK97 family phage major capsid protein